MQPNKNREPEADSALPQGGCWGDMLRMLGGCLIFFPSPPFLTPEQTNCGPEPQSLEMRCSGSAEVKLMGPLPGWHDWKRIGHFVS